jgi:hypothetical protein
MKRDDGFDDWLDTELRRRLDPGLRSVPAPRYQKERNRRGQMPKFITGLVAALATKTAAGLTVAALAAGATGAVVVGVSTHAFSESMKSTVEACKASGPRTGQNGIGGCVSSAARQHASQARENNPGLGDKNPKPGPHATKTPKGNDQGGKNDDSGQNDNSAGNDGGSSNAGHSGDHHGPPTTAPPHRD